MKCMVCESHLTAGCCENPSCALFLGPQPRLVIHLDGPLIRMAIEGDEPESASPTGGLSV